MSIQKYIGVGLIEFKDTGDFAFAGLKNPHWKWLHEAILLRTDVQPCKHPETHMAAHAPMSVLELRSAGPDRVARFSDGSCCRYALLNWNATITGEKVLLWEAAFITGLIRDGDGSPIPLNDTTANEAYDEKRALWEKHGYFNLKTWDEQQKAKRNQESSARIRETLRRTPIQKRQPAKDPLFLPTLEVLERAFKHTAKSTLAKDEAAKISAFEFESGHPSGDIDQINYLITRAHRRAHLNKTPAPTDKDIAAEIAALMPKSGITPHAVKLRRQSLCIPGGARGPRPSS